MLFKLYSEFNPAVEILRQIPNIVSVWSVKTTDLEAHATAFSIAFIMV